MDSIKYVEVTKIDRKQHVEVTGNEPWLAEVYSHFAVPKGQTPPKITGWIDVDPLKMGFAEVKGELKYAPFVDCSRCGDKITWQIEAPFEMEYRDHKTQSLDRKEVDLERDELDHYFLKEGKVDIEELVNEQIELAIPSRTVCEACELAGDSDEVYTEQGEAPKSPFSILSSLKN